MINEGPGDIIEYLDQPSEASIRRCAVVDQEEKSVRDSYDLSDWRPQQAFLLSQIN